MGEGTQVRLHDILVFSKLLIERLPYIEKSSQLYRKQSTVLTS